MLEAKELSAEQIDFIMSEHGKMLQAEQAKSKEAVEKSIKSLNEQIAALDKQNKKYQESLNNSESLDAKAKEEIEKLQKEHNAKIKELQLASNDEIAKIRREGETKDFFCRIG